MAPMWQALGLIDDSVFFLHFCSESFRFKGFPTFGIAFGHFNRSPTEGMCLNEILGLLSRRPSPQDRGTWRSCVLTLQEEPIPLVQFLAFRSHVVLKSNSTVAFRSRLGLT